MPYTRSREIQISTLSGAKDRVCSMKYNLVPNDTFMMFL
jgi:hypothetical protein